VRLASSVSSRTATFDRAFAPFGEMYNTVTGGTSNPDFTGDTQDTISGEFDTLFRQLHPGQGRWISPDPGGLAVADPANPQSWNRYAYVVNNPLALVDPLGLVPPSGSCDFEVDHIVCYSSETGAGANGGGGGGFVVLYAPIYQWEAEGGDQWQPVIVGLVVVGYSDLSGPDTGPKGGGAANNGTQKACPAVPAHPANANVNSNISLTNVVYYANWLNPPTQAAFTDAWLVSQVRPNGPWDYKTQGQQYDAFGNFNFGATGAAAGIPLQVLQAGAGAVSTLVGTNSSQYGSWYQPPLYGHAPIKSDMIAAGYAYYQNGCK